MDNQKQILKRHILEDVLVHIEAKHIIPTQDRLLGLTDWVDDSIKGEKCDVLMDNQCEACARGSLIYSYMTMNKDHYKDKEFIRSGYDKDSMGLYSYHPSSIENDLINEGLFTAKELAILEILFEGTIFDHQISMISADEEEMLLDSIDSLPNNSEGCLKIIIHTAIRCLPEITVENMSKQLFKLLK
jgi:hypothetical protein